VSWKLGMSVQKQQTVKCCPEETPAEPDLSEQYLSEIRDLMKEQVKK